MSTVYYARKKEIQEIVEKLDYRNRENNIKDLVSNLIKNNLYSSNDEDILETLKNCTNRFISLLELDLTEKDFEICTTTSKNTYWSNENGFSNQTSFKKVWNEQYAEKYIIISEECEIISIDKLIELTTKK